MSDNKKDHWFMQILKVLGILVGAIVLLAVVGFGLLVGLCTFGRR